MKLIFHTIAVTGFFMLSAKFPQVTTLPTVQQNSELYNPLNQLITRIDPLIPRDDEDEDTTPRGLTYSSGVLNVILGVVTGDLRRVLEDGAFSFVNKGARDRVFLFYNNLLGKTTTLPPRRRKSTTPEFDSDGDETEVTTLSYRKSTLNYRKPISTSLGQGSSKRKTSPPVPESEDDELVERFEKVLVSHFPLDDDTLSTVIKDNSVTI